MPKWTKDQEKAIYSKWRNPEKTQSANVLVNAAAGSGKTAVLVERIINKLSSDMQSPDYCEADSLLVVTFTNAAAREMQQRISDALSKKYAQAIEDGNEALAKQMKKQLSKIHLADIITIDTFCLKTVKSYFHLLNIDPDFKIGDVAECEMLKDDVLEELFEKYYADEEFIRLVCMFSESRDDSGLAKIIKKIFDFTRSQPDPQEWMREKLELLTVEGEKNLYYQMIKQTADDYLYSVIEIYKSMLNTMINAVEGCNLSRSEAEIEKIIENNQPETPNEFHFAFESIYKIAYDEYFFAKSLKDSQWDEICEAVKNYKFAALNAAVRLRDKEKKITDSEIIDLLKEKRSAAKSLIQDKLAPLFAFDTKEINRITNDYIYPTVKGLVKFCNLFEELYYMKKDSKNILEFSDVEHLCLELFTKYPEIVQEMKEKYTEILMDEYQDSNALQEAIFSAISRGDNRFTVGDMKQSIYRFRSSDPDIFKSKIDIYQKDISALNQKVVLSKNFRSRPEVIDGINSVFEKVMSESVGGIEYDSDQRLYCGDENYENKNEGLFGENKCECFVVLKDDNSQSDDESVTDVVLEARFIAKKIRQMYDCKYKVRVKSKPRYDENANIINEGEFEYRPVEFGDFAILMSSCKNVAKIYQKELSECGINCLAKTGGYFDRQEIKLMTALLKLINNPYNDIPLIASLRSPVFSFSDDELCQIRINSYESFYDAVKVTAQKEELIGEKCRMFMDKLSHWRYISRIMPVNKLIWYLYENTCVYDFAQAVYGAEAATNLRLLFTRAKEYENSGYQGLFNFIRYIDIVKKKETDLTSAVIAGDESNAVKLMTVHKSKGLEFPVVFLAGATKKFNREDLKGRLFLHKDLGFGLDYINYEKSFFAPSMQKNALKIKIGDDMTSEEMRKLYVALTRAKEKLIVTGVSDVKNDSAFEQSVPKKYNAWMSSVGEDKKVKKSYTRSAESFMDWIAPVAMTDSINWNFEVVEYSKAAQMYEGGIDESETVTEERSDRIRVNEYIYPYIKSTKLPVKLSVTELKNAHITNSITPLIRMPEFLKEKRELSGAQRGTAVHYVMQRFIPFNGMAEGDIKEFILKLVRDSELTLEEADAVNPKMIIDFYSSSIGQRILKSKNVVHEAPFELEILASSVYDVDDDSRILLQGVIDCYFYEGDEIVIVDYKTDYYEDIEEIKEKYALQLQYYKLAIEQICKKTVKNSYLYLFSTKSMIEYS